MISDFNQQEWLSHPTGKIEKGTYCNKCARFNSRHMACNAVLLKDNKVLLVQRAQDPEAGNWDIPGGYLDWDETLEECAARELQEETGLIARASDLKFFSIFSNPDNAAHNQVVDIYFITKKFSGEISIEEDEVLDYKWFDLTDLPETLAFDHDVMFKKLNKELAI